MLHKGFIQRRLESGSVCDRQKTKALLVFSKNLWFDPVVRIFLSLNVKLLRVSNRFFEVKTTQTQIIKLYAVFTTGTNSP